MRTEKEIQEALSRVLAKPKPDHKDIGTKYDNEADYLWCLYHREGSLFVLRWVLEETEGLDIQGEKVK